MNKILIGLAAAAVLGLAVFWFVTSPSTISSSALAADYKPNLANGETMFNIGGCAACHQTTGQKERTHLGGGLGLTTAFGTFYAPNISSDKTHGIGDWSELQFVNAVMRGVGHNGEHLYPALPYTSYQRMAINDVRDLHAYMMTLPADAAESKAAEVKFPFSIRRLLGGWKFLFMDNKPFVADASKDAVWNRGAYLVNGPGHCAECHSPRNGLGGIKEDGRFTGGPDAEGKGWVPNITPHADGIKDWDKAGIEEALKSGLTPSFDSLGGSMAEVVQNTGRLSDGDREAIATYLLSLTPKPGKAPEKKS